MTMQFDIPFPLHVSLVDNQIREIEDDINERIRILTQQTGLLFEIDDYSVRISVKLREVSQK